MIVEGNGEMGLRDIADWICIRLFQSFCLIPVSEVLILSPIRAEGHIILCTNPLGVGIDETFLISLMN